MDASKLPLSPGRQAGDFVYVSGQLGFAEDGALVGPGITEQTNQTMANIERVLRSHGAKLSDIVKINIWLTSKTDFAEFNAEYTSHFESACFPARSTVVSELLIEGAKVEIDAVAFIGNSPD